MLTNRYPTICFVLINLLVFVSSCASKKAPVEMNADIPTSTYSCFTYPDSTSLRLKTTINYKDIQMSGITIAKMYSDTVMGMFINEFGVTVLGFRTKETQCKLFSVIGQLDNPLIKNELKNDLGFIFLVCKYPSNTFWIDFPNNNAINLAKFPGLDSNVISQRYYKKELTGDCKRYNDTIVFTNKKQNITYTFVPIEPKK